MSETSVVKGEEVQATAATAAAKSPPPHMAKPATLPAVQSLLIMIVTAIFIVTFTVQPFRIPSESMEPTLLVGDFLLVKKLCLTDGASAPLPEEKIRRGEIIVFRYPVDPGLHLVKRVVGLPGDHLHLRGNRVYIDGRPLTESYAVYRTGPPDPYRDNFPRLDNTDPSVDARWWIAMHKLVDDGDLIVPQGEYFVLGDNRNDSEDSRYWGFVPRATIVGTPLVVYFSLRMRGEEDSALSLEEPQHAGMVVSVLHFARWDRILHIVH